MYYRAGVTLATGSTLVAIAVIITVHTQIFDSIIHVDRLHIKAMKMHSIEQNFCAMIIGFGYALYLLTFLE